MTLRDRRAVLAAGLFASLCGISSQSPTKLEVGWISREPRLRAPETLDGPRTAGWPAEGSVERWIGHVLNRGTSAVPDVTCVWSVDGSEAWRTVIELAPGDNEIVFPWRWTFDRHQIDLTIAPPPEAGDSTAVDNHVTIDSDALSIAFYIDRSEYTRLANGPRSFEYRMQEQIPYWNSVLANAVYPSTPDGVLDRLRLDKVIVVPDGTPIPDEDYAACSSSSRRTTASWAGVITGTLQCSDVEADGLNLWHHRRSPVFRRRIGGGTVLGLKDVMPESYARRLPSETAVTFSENGTRVTGGEVDVFLDQNPNAYRDTYSANPPLTLPMNEDGAALLPGDILRDQPPWRQPPKAEVILIRVRTPAARSYVFVAVWEFNRLYFRDGGGPSALDVPVKMIRY